MKLEQRIELAHRSVRRMVEALKLSRDVDWWNFMRREAWILLKRAVELWWHIVRLKK